MNKKIFTSLSALALSLPLLAACNKSDFEITFSENILKAYVGIKYDFGNDVLTNKQSGIKYSLKAEYYDYTSKEMKELPVDNLTFTPKTQSDVIVTVTAKNYAYIHSKKTTIPVAVKADTIDSLLTNGYSSWADEGVSKSINIDSKYIKEGCGNTSIAVKYYGSKTWENQGATIICPNNFRCLDCWTDKEWKNAILTFWVYNPTEYDFEFQLRVQNNHEGDTTKVDIDWGDPKNTPQYAKAGQWTQIFFSMNKININRPLRITEDESYKDYLIIKTYWKGTPTGGVAYTWNMFVDGMDVVDASKYPDVDTTPFETIAQGWENMATDCGSGSGWAKSTVITVSNDACHKSGYDKSTKGLQLTFNNGLEPGDLNYAVVFSPEYEKGKGGISDLPDFGKGSITADIKFSEDITDKTVTFVATDEKWNTKKINAIALTDLKDGWYRLKFGLDKATPFANIGKVIRFGMTFNGVTYANRQTAKVYVDNIFYDPDGNEPGPSYVRGEAFSPTSDASVRLTNAVTVSSEAVINVDIKRTSSDGKVAVALMDDWGTTGHGYFGYYELETTETYKGVTKTTLGDGYTRYSFKVKELDKAAEQEGAPKTIDHIYVWKDHTTATGYIDVSVS